LLIAAFADYAAFDSDAADFLRLMLLPPADTSYACAA
jgi:hypothetical protein